MSIKHIIESGYYVAVDPDGNEISRGSKKDKRYVDIINHAKEHGLDGEYRIIQPEVKVGIVVATNITAPPPPPPSSPPEWTAVPNPIFIAGVGGQYNLNDNTTDPEGDPLVFVKTAGTWPVGWSLNPNGIITVGSSCVEGVTAGFTVTCDDGTNAPVASSSFSATVNAASSPPATGFAFPRLGLACYGWGGTGKDSKPGGVVGCMQRIAAHDVVIINVWRTWTSSWVTGPSKDTSNICPYIKTFNADIKIYNYVNPSEASDGRQNNVEPYIEWSNDGDPATGGKGTDEGWWLYDGSGTTYPEDVMFPSGTYPSAQINYGSDNTDAAGLTCAQWWARAQYCNNDDQGDWVTSGYGFRKEYGYDGWWMDIMRYEPRTGGDFDEDSSFENKDTATALAYKAQGDARHTAEVLTLDPNLLVGGNYTQNGGVNGTTEYNLAVTSGYTDLVNLCFMEGIMGRTSSIETWGGFDAMMRYYKRMMTLNAGMDPQHTMFDNWEFTEGSTTIWEGTHSKWGWGRYGLCCCLQDNGYYGFPDPHIDCNILDEYSFDLGDAVDAPKYDGADVTTSNSGSGYLDYQLGVHLREFQNGIVLVNPKGNGERTITLPDPGAGFHWQRLLASDYGNQDPGVNDGLIITSQTLPERHGIIIKRVGSFPRLGVTAYGGWGISALDGKPGGMTGRIQRIAKHDIAQLGMWRQWFYSGPTGPDKDMTDICPYIKSFNPNIILYEYTIAGSDVRVDSMATPWPEARVKWEAETWYLYDGTGTVVPDDVKITAVWPEYQGNMGSLVPLDSAGVHPMEWMARAEHANEDDVDGDWVTNGYGLRSEYGWDGVWQDIMRFEPRIGGDWDRAGLPEEGKGSEVALAAKSYGDHLYHAEWDILDPNLLHGGNYTFNGAAGGNLDDYNEAIARGYKNFVHSPLMENCMGITASPEYWGGWNDLMRYYKRMMTLVDAMSPQHVFFQMSETIGDSESDPNIWDTTHSIYDWGRYGLCSCLQDNGYFCHTTSTVFVDCNILDEYDFDLGAAIDAPKYDGNDPTTATTGSGYNAYENGVHLREFTNGLAIVNPKNNGTQTITLPSPGAGFHWERLLASDYPGEQDIVTNDGATITTQQLPERHGIIIKRVVNTPSFEVAQGSTTNLPALPGLRGHGYDSVHGSGRHLGTPATTVLYVDSLATDSSNTDSTHGSLKWCLAQTFPRVIVPAISGMIDFPTDSTLHVLNPYVTYAGQCAPGDGLHVNDLMLIPASKEQLYWHWSGFMENATIQGAANVIQVGSNSSTEDQLNIVLANCSAMYGMDESISVFNSGSSYVSDYTVWQCLIGSSPKITSGPTYFSNSYGSLFDNTNLPMPKGSILRCYYGNCLRRSPRIDAGIVESSNNFVYGGDFYLEWNVTSSVEQAEATEINARNNGFVKGSMGNNFEPILFEDATAWELGGYYHQSGNVKDTTITDVMVNNSTPISWPPGDSEQGTPSANATPEGMVLRAIADSDAGLLELHALMDSHVGARPNNRLAVHQQELDWCANYLNSTTPTGSRLTAPQAPPTVASVAINHETTGSHGLGVIPTTGKDVVQASGYTLLEEWLHAHHAYFMPAGWDL